MSWSPLPTGDVTCQVSGSPARQISLPAGSSAVRPAQWLWGGFRTKQRQSFSPAIPGVKPAETGRGSCHAHQRPSTGEGADEGLPQFGQLGERQRSW